MAGILPRGEPKGVPWFAQGPTQAAPHPVQVACPQDHDTFRHGHIKAEQVTVDRGAHAARLLQLPCSLRGNDTVSSHAWIWAAKT